LTGLPIQKLMLLLLSAGLRRPEQGGYHRDAVDAGRGLYPG
jgi:hypothetical protein